MRKINWSNKKQIFNAAILAFAGLLLAVMPVSMITKASGFFSSEPPILTRTANLAAPSGVNPHGKATYNVYANNNRELELEVEEVDLANGTVLTAFINNAQVGTITVSDRQGRLKLKTESGNTVPMIIDGSTAQIKNGTTVLVSGIFATAATPTPTPTVSPSPTVSPTVSPSPTASPTPTPAGENELFATLSGPTIGGILPRGYGEYESKPTRTDLEIELAQVNLPAGTILNVTVGTTAVGNIVMRAEGEGKLKLRSTNGDIIPVIIDGTSVTVKNGTATILSGIFHGSTSPTPSPSPSTQGRYFEVHPTGSALTPPVTTTATGEVKVTLNATETSATLSGEFRGLSSAETSAVIESVVNGTTAAVYTFPVVGGTSGHLASATITVTAAQVQQLRTGVWFARISSVNHPTGELGGKLIQHNHSADFDGDGSNDLSLFRPATATLYTQNSAGFTAQIIGTPTDKIVSADYDGDGKTDAAVFANGTWTIRRSSDAGTTVKNFGLASDTPVRGDFNGDGRNDIAVYRASTGTWYFENAGGFSAVRFGIAEDKPVSGDFDGDGKTDIAVYRPSLGNWYYIKSGNGQVAALHFGAIGDLPTVGDFDGDGADDVAVWRPSTGVWYSLNSADGNFRVFGFGISSDIPVQGNYDGDNKTDIAVFRAATGVWYIWRSIDNTMEVRFFGLANDIPTTTF
jgi:CHRD domain/FG-GAP-like repeat